MDKNTNQKQKRLFVSYQLTLFALLFAKQLLCINAISKSDFNRCLKIKANNFLTMPKWSHAHFCVALDANSLTRISKIWLTRYFSVYWTKLIIRKWKHLIDLTYPKFTTSFGNQITTSLIMWPLVKLWAIYLCSYACPSRVAVTHPPEQKACTSSFSCWILKDVISILSS